MSNDALHELDREFETLLSGLTLPDSALESAAGSGRLGEGRSTPGDGTSSQGVNCTCCCN